MDFSKYHDLLFRLEGKVLHLTLNRPDQLNGVNETLDEDLSRVFTDIAGEPDINVVVVTGAGRAFSAGGDMDLLQYTIDHPESFATGALHGKQMISSILDCPKPIIAKVNGPAVGLGATLALYCDIIFASSYAKFGDPHVSVGFAAGDGGAIIWPQLVGFARAKHYLFTGELIDATEAERIGLINKVLPAEELDAYVDGYAERLANGATRAIQMTKMATNVALKQVVHSALDASFAFEFLSNYTKDHREAVAAFREKRKPVFTGE